MAGRRRGYRRNLGIGIDEDTAIVVKHETKSMCCSGSGFTVDGSDVNVEKLVLESMYRCFKHLRHQAARARGDEIVSSTVERRPIMDKKE